MNRILLPLILALAVLSSCRKDMTGYVFDNVAYLDVAETKAAQPAIIGRKIAERDYQMHAAIAYPSDSDIAMRIAVDESKVAKYNSENGTSWEMLDSRYYDFAGGEVVIPAGKTVSDVATLHLKNLMGEGEQEQGALPLDETYLLPVSISDASISLLEESATVYYLVKRSSNITTAAFLGELNWINFPTLDVYSENSMALNNLTAVTMEAFIYIDKFITTIKTSAGNDLAVNISSVMGKETDFLLRIGDASFQRQQFQLVGQAASTNFDKMPRSDAGKNIEPGRWYHVACTYDQKTKKACIYVDGELQSETVGGDIEDGAVLNFADRALYDMWSKMPEDEQEATKDQYGGLDEAYQFFIGKSYDDYRPLNGKIAEVRLWSVARTQQEIYDNMYEITDPETVPELIGYWKFDEGQGNVVKDYSRYGNDGVSQLDLTWPDGIEIQKTH